MSTWNDTWALAKVRWGLHTGGHCRQHVLDLEDNEATSGEVLNLTERHYQSAEMYLWDRQIRGRCFVCGGSSLIPEVLVPAGCELVRVAIRRYHRGGRCNGGHCLVEEYDNDGRPLLQASSAYVLAVMGTAPWQEVAEPAHVTVIHEALSKGNSTPTMRFVKYLQKTLDEILAGQTITLRQSEPGRYRLWIMNYRLLALCHVSLSLCCLKTFQAVATAQLDQRHSCMRAVLNAIIRARCMKLASEHHDPETIAGWFRPSQLHCLAS